MLFFCIVPSLKFKQLEIVKLRRRACDFVFMGTLNKAAGNKNHSKHINESGLWKSTCKILFTKYVTQGLLVLAY